MSQNQAEQEKRLSQTSQTLAFPSTTQQPGIQSNAQAANVRQGTQTSRSQAGCALPNGAPPQISRPQLDVQRPGALHHQWQQVGGISPYPPQQNPSLQPPAQNSGQMLPSHAPSSQTVLIPGQYAQALLQNASTPFDLQQSRMRAEIEIMFLDRETRNTAALVVANNRIALMQRNAIAESAHRRHLMTKESEARIQREDDRNKK
ncbi:hypothetical protein V8E51_004919 [Hyaloscypha variabilis]